jgi:hypothetical protein
MAKIQITVNTKHSKDVEQQDLPYSLLVRMQKETTTLENSLAVTYKHIHTTNQALWYLPKGVKNLCPHKKLFGDVYRSFVHNCQTF